MMRKLLVVSLVALATVPAAAFAGTSSVSTGASQRCIAVKNMLRPTVFEEEFGSFGGCVSGLTPLARQDASTAAALCRSEQANAGFSATHGGKTFARFYGTSHKLANAFGNCVAAKELVAARLGVAAASKCQAAQADATFPSTHGGKTFSQFFDGFAKCVVLTVHPSTMTTTQPAPVSPQPSPATGGCGPVTTGGPPLPQLERCAEITGN